MVELSIGYYLNNGAKLIMDASGESNPSSPVPDSPASARSAVDAPRLLALYKSVAQDYEFLWRFRKEFERRSFVTKDEAAIELSLNWDPDFLPNFEFANGGITSRQHDFFGTFALGEAMAEFLKGIEDYGAYSLLEAKNYDPLANMAAYTSAFHLLDSFLCLNGILFLRSPVGRSAWKFHRFLPQKGYEKVPVLKLAPDGLFRANGNRVNWLRATFESIGKWTYVPDSLRSVHRTKWAIFGGMLLSRIERMGVAGVPKEIRQFLGYCAGHLTYHGVKEASNDTVEGLRNLIQYTCIGYRLGNLKFDPLIVDLRNLAIYKNRTFDDYMRMAGPRYDQRLIKTPGKMTGMHVARLAQGLARVQAGSLSQTIEQTKRSSVSESFSDGLRSSFLMSNLVELDSTKVVKSEVYRVLHPALKQLVKTYFGDRRYLPVSEDVIPWAVGPKDNVAMHIIKPTTTYGICVSLNPQWFLS